MPESQLPLDEAQALYTAARTLDRTLDRMRSGSGMLNEHAAAAYVSISNLALQLRNIATMLEAGKLFR